MTFQRISYWFRADLLDCGCRLLSCPVTLSSGCWVILDRRSSPVFHSRSSPHEVLSADKNAVNTFNKLDVLLTQWAQVQTLFSLCSVFSKRRRRSVQVRMVMTLYLPVEMTESEMKMMT